MGTFELPMSENLNFILDVAVKMFMNINSDLTLEMHKVVAVAYTNTCIEVP